MIGRTDLCSASSAISWHPSISDHSQYSLTTLILVFLPFLWNTLFTVLSSGVRTRWPAASSILLLFYYICIRNLKFIKISDSRYFCIGFVDVVNLATCRTLINVNTGLSVTRVGTNKLERLRYDCRNWNWPHQWHKAEGVVMAYNSSCLGSCSFCFSSNILLMLPCVFLSYFYTTVFRSSSKKRAYRALWYVQTVSWDINVLPSRSITVHLFRSSTASGPWRFLPMYLHSSFVFG